MSEQTEIQYTLTINTEPSHSQIRKLETSLIRIGGYLKQVFGVSSVSQAIEVGERLIITLHSIQVSMRAVQAASGPIGWLYAGTTVVAASMSGLNAYEEIMGTVTGA